MIRNLGVLLAVTMVWIFFYVPNPWLSLFNIQGNEHFPNLIYFGLPVVLAIASIFAMSGSLWRRIAWTFCVPLLGFCTYLITSVAGVYSNEGLMGYWFVLLPSVLAYVGGVLVAALGFTVMERAMKITPEERSAR